MPRMHSCWKFIILIVFFLWHCEKIQWSPQFEIAKHELDIKLIPSQGKIVAKDRLILEINHETTQIDLFLSKQFQVDSVFCEGQPIKYKLLNKFQLKKYLAVEAELAAQKIEPVNLLSIRIKSLNHSVPLEIFYQGSLESYSLDTTKKLSDVKNRILIVPEKDQPLFLSQRFWYPNIFNSLSKYQVAVLTPDNYEVITVGKLSSRIQRDPFQKLTVYENDVPVDAIALIAGPYIFTPLIFGDLEMFTYFFPEEQQHSARFIESATRFIELYDQEIGPYHYKKLAIVASPLPINQAFPSFCMINRSEIARPITSRTLLGHLICRNWWGEAVFRSPSSGDWSEGLTTYLAEHLYEERITPDNAIDTRYHYLRQYALQIAPDSEIPLNQCWDNSVPIQHILNTTKGMMLFHQLRLLLGDKIFFQALREIYQANRSHYFDWHQLKTAFENATSVKLTEFFEQWLRNIGAPQLYITNPKMQSTRKKTLISTTISAQTIPQSETTVFPYKINLPLRIHTTRQTINHTLVIDTSTVSAEFNSRYKPVSIELDPDFNVFRRFYPQEIQPFIGQVLNGSRKLFVLPGKIKRQSLIAYRHQIKKFLRAGEKVRIKYDYQVTPNDLKTKTLILFGGILENRITAQVHKALPPDIQIVRDCFIYNKHKYWKQTHAIVATLKNPYNPDNTILIYWGISPESIENSAEDLQDYQNYGFIIMRDGNKVTWKQWKIAKSPLIHQFRESKTRATARKSRSRRR